MDSLKVEGFKLPTKRDITSYIPAPFMGVYGRWATPRPYPNPQRCTGCRTCADICPVDAITMVNNVAVVDNKALEALLKDLCKNMERPRVTLLKAELDAKAKKSFSPRFWAKGV